MYFSLGTLLCVVYTRIVTCTIMGDKVLANTKCMRCSEAAATRVRTTDPLCRNCFLEYCIHKFRAEFGKSGVIRDQESVCVAYSGGASSAAMLHLIRTGLSKRAQRKLRFQPCILLIDEIAWQQCVPTANVCRANQHLTDLANAEFPSYVFQLEQVFDSSAIPVPVNEWSSNLQPDSGHTRGQLSRLVHALITVTTRENVLSLLRYQILERCARHLGVSKVLLGDSQQRQATRLLSAVMQGSGSSIPQDMSFMDNRREDIVFLKPMREFAADEVDTYNVLCNVQSTPVDTIQSGSLASFDTLTHTFVSNLQGEFQSTVNNICRIGEKLEATDTSANKCLLCKTRCSEKYCYACQRIVTELGGTSLLPATLVNSSSELQ